MMSWHLIVTRRLASGFGVLVFGQLVVGATGEKVNLVVDLPGRSVSVSVDSTSPGYNTHVLTDGTWIEKGKEITQEYSHRDRLGNCGNSWVSAPGPDEEHWIQVDWPEPVTVNRVEIWWTIPKWYPRAFRVECLSDMNWVPAVGRDVWLAATDQRSVVPFESREITSLRFVQLAGGSDDRGLMGAQEVLAFHEEEAPRREPVGARELSAEEARRLRPRPLARNIGRLHEEWPGADRAVVWLPDGSAAASSALNDGDRETAATLPRDADGLGIQWPIRHVIDGAAVFFVDDVPEPAACALEVCDGRKWVPVREGLACRLEPGEGRLSCEFEPLATRAFRVRLPGDDRQVRVAEMEVYRYLPAGNQVWPDRVVQENRLERDILAGPEEPSFESVALWGLSMTPARALLGLKDTPHEIGVTWDGTLIGWDTFRFRFGEEGNRLADYRDTVRRSLIDGWRPGVVVEGQIGRLAVRETALLSYVEGNPSRPALFIRVEARNLSDEPIRSFLEAEATGGRAGESECREGCLLRGDEVVLLSKAPCRAGSHPGRLRIDYALSPKGEIRLDFVHPRVHVPLEEAVDGFGAASFDQALTAFKRYWDDVLAPATKIEVPEDRVNRMAKAVLTQIFINGDGDVMRYGSEPSAYSRNHGTYLTGEFLHKVDTYKEYAHRHQQYRNGLQPHYAVGAYRFSRDEAWIRKHLPLLRECAEWTIAERKKTMKLEGGVKPLHWGLLPKWSYGGDISGLQCYPLYANLCCWRGLHDTAWLLEQLGEKETAARYAEEARDYRQVIEHVIDTIYQKDRRPPFLPGRVYGRDPVGNDYYQLFMGCLLHLQPFDAHGKRIGYVTNFLEQDNRTFCLLPRFRRDAGPGGLDGLYGLGYILSKLHGDSIEPFLLGFYGYLAYNMGHETFASRETNLIYASDLHIRSQYPVPDKSDPLPCSSAVALHFLRNMLVTEELTGPGAFSGNLLLLYGAPRAWLRDGQTIRVHNAPTHCGVMSFEVVSKLQAGRVEARVTPPTRNPCPRIKLRLRHPERRPIQSVSVNGSPWHDVDRDREMVLLPGEIGPSQVVVTY
ncbi:MAG: discoidin domain-containing protein [Planctomycetota bacterium]|jgi:hypothetical protein